MGRGVNRDGMQGGGVSRECDAGGGGRMKCEEGQKHRADDQYFDKQHTFGLHARKIAENEHLAQHTACLGTSIRHPT